MARSIEECLGDMVALITETISWYEEVRVRITDSVEKMNEEEFYLASGEMIAIAKLTDWVSSRTGSTKTAKQEFALQCVFNLQKEIMRAKEQMNDRPTEN